MQRINTVDEYIGQFDGDAKDRLVKLRRLIKTEVPEAEEGIMYGLVGYKYRKKPLVYFGSFTSHTGFYATPEGHESFLKELAAYKQGRGSVQFPHNKPLPEDLIRRMVQYRKESLDQL